jgi:DNA-binding NarL/FixJ family response regulator
MVQSRSREGDGAKVLVVEDNATFRQILTESLQRLFPRMVIQEAAEGIDGLQKVDVFHPEFIFMDIQLPGENGLSLTKKIKAKYPDVRVIILTTYDIPEYREAALRVGATRFIPKDSLDWEEIEELVKSISPP